MERAKKECILNAAARAFAKVGFRKASVDDIARDAGVAKGTIYLACESKEDLFYQSVQRDVRAWVAKVASCIDPRKPADELLGDVATAAFAYLHQHTLVRDLLTGIYYGQLPGWTERFEDLRSIGRNNVVEILRLGIRQGRFRADLDVETTALLLEDLQLAGMLQETRLGGGQPDVLKLRMTAGLQLVLDGLRVRPGA